MDTLINTFINEFNSFFVLLFIIFFYRSIPDLKLCKKEKKYIENVIGLESVKKDLEQYIDYIENRKKYKDSGYKIPKGLLFIGPPGTGKTMLAREISKKTKSKFYHHSGSDFVELYVGVGAKRIRELFSKARKQKSAIIFIDEIDSIGRKRGNDTHSERDGTLNSLLVEMDGFNDKDNILVIGSTNRSSILDNALLRSGRFDRKIIFDKPNIEERKSLFKLYLNKIRLKNDFKQNLDKHLVKLSRLTSNLTGADIKNICNQAVGLYLKRDNEFKKILKNYYKGNKSDGTTLDDLLKSIDEIMIGMEKKERLMSEEEKKIVSYHEAGHALISYMMKETKPPIKVSIIPRGESALGFSMQEPIDKKLYNKKELISKICVLLGGRISEEIKFGKITTGASDDIYKLTKIAYNIVTTYGMSNLIGHINLNREKNSQYDSIDISESRKKEIDLEVKKIINECYNFTINILKKNKKYIEMLAELLFKKEELIYSDFDNLFWNYKIEDSVEFKKIGKNSIEKSNSESNNINSIEQNNMDEDNIEYNDVDEVLL